MFFKEWLEQSTKILDQVGIGTARLDALVLLEDVTRRDRGWLLTYPEPELTVSQIKKLNKLVERRASHEPLAYIRNKTEFYGREFYVDHRVLEPRPESETMIDLLKKLPRLSARPLIADVGAGSGALGITAKLEMPRATIELIELDPGAIKVAKKNIAKHTTNISILQSDLLNNTSKNYDVLLCNLPYVPDVFHINPAAMREPKIAIFGGTDGLNVYSKLFNQLNNIIHKPLYVLCESLPPQHEKLTEIASKNDYKLSKTDDFIQVFEKDTN